MLLRLLAAAPFAALFAIFLFLSMLFLIRQDEPVLGEAKQLRFDIAPTVAEIEPEHMRQIPDEVREVKTPPPPPRISVQRSNAPVQPNVTFAGAIPEMETPDIDVARDLNFNVSDRDAQPMVRIPPVYPPRAAEQGMEGNCLMNFDVGPDGTPTNIQALNCTSDIFRDTSIRAVERWKYQPKVVKGAAVSRTGVRTQIEYKLET